MKEEKMNNKGLAIAFLTVWGFFAIVFGIATAIMGKNHDSFAVFLALTIGCALVAGISGSIVLKNSFTKRMERKKQENQGKKY